MSRFVTRRKFISSSTVAAATAAVTASGLAGRLSGARVKEKIKVGQIGVGHAHASGKMQAYRDLTEHYEVVGVVETDPKLRQRAERSDVYRGVRWITQEQLLNTPGLKVVAVETRVRDLLNVAEVCVNAGLYVHIDKPAGSSLPQFRRILATATSKGRVVQMGYMYRYNPCVLLMQELLKKGWLGEPFEVHTVMSKVVRPDSRKGLTEYPGGIMFELGCHITDLTIGVLGRPDRVTGFNRHSADVDDGLLDNQLAVLEYPRALATIKSSGQEVSGFDRRHFVVCGTEGTCHIEPLDSPGIRLALSTPRGEYKSGYQVIKFPEYRRYVGDALDLAQVVRGEKAFEFSPEHDIAVQETVLRACNLPLD